MLNKGVYWYIKSSEGSISNLFYVLELFPPTNTLFWYITRITWFVKCIEVDLQLFKLMRCREIELM